MAEETAGGEDPGAWGEQWARSAPLASILAAVQVPRALEALALRRPHPRLAGPTECVRPGPLWVLPAEASALGSWFSPAPISTGFSMPAVLW